MYFSEFPKIYYDFPTPDGSTVLQVLTDITTNVRVRKKALENITLYDEYDILDGETPEIIAEKIYGNPELHWVIMLINQRYDYLKDFPMSNLELELNSIEYYGADNLNNVHHYEKDGIITEAKAIMKFPSSVLPFLKVNDYVVNIPVANCRIDSIDVVNKTANVLVDYGKFTAGEFVSLRGIRTDEETGIVTYSTVINFTIPTDGFIVNGNYETITNAMYESRLNESKRRIKLISKRLVDQFVNEFKALVV